jgi:Zn-dependent M28 family amino/carboxypeptidase
MHSIFLTFILTFFMTHPPTEVSQERLYKDVAFLTSLQPARNYANLASLNKAADYIYQEFSNLGCQPEVQTFTADGKEYKNIIASFGKMDGERVIIGAHYDVCGDQPGADDNASAVAGLLETARLLYARKPALNYRIDFVAYSLEEPPYFATEHMGSAVHARYLHDKHIRVKAMICYEMIGYFSDKPHSQQFPDAALSKIYPNKGNFIIVVGRQGQETFTRNIQALMKANSSIDVQSIVFPYAEGLAGLSDHRNYWKYNYPAVMINDTSFLRNPNYHKKTDTIDTLDFKKMVEVVKGVYAAATQL